MNPGQLCGALALLVVPCVSGCIAPGPRLALFPRDFCDTPASPHADGCATAAVDFWVVNARPCCVQSETFAPEQLTYGRFEASTEKLRPVSLTTFLGAVDPAVPLCILIHGYGVKDHSAMVDA